MRPKPATSKSTLPRALRGLDVFALGVNCVIGSGVFLLPGLVADGLGPASLGAVALAGTVACLIALCFAEVSSRFSGSGGAYAYARSAFGDAAGFGVGWVAALAGVIAWAAIVNAFAVTLGRWVPAVASDIGHALAIVVLLLVLGMLNVLGVRLGAGVSTAVTGIKLAALVGFVAVGAFAIEPGHFVPFVPAVSEGWHGLTQGALVMFYAFVGFENMVVPAGEIRNPERTLPVAVVAIMAVVTALYLGVQAVAIGTLPDLAGTENAVVVATGAFLGSLGERAIGAAVVVSVLGVAAASALILPRRVSALAEDGHLPAMLGRPHPRFGTPWLSVVVVHVIAGVVALSGTFAELVALAVIARFLQYAPTCLAVIVLRRADPPGSPGPGFRLPGGALIPILALAASGLLLLAARGPHVVAFLVAVAVGIPVYGWMHRNRMQQGRQP